MATLNVTKTWSADEVLTHTDLNNNFQDVEDFINGANLDTANISTKYATVAYVISVHGIGANETRDYKFKLPSGSSPVGDVKLKTLSLTAPVSPGGSMTAEVFDDGSTKMSSALSVTTDSTQSTETFTAGDVAQGSIIMIRVITSSYSAAAGNTVPTVALHVLTEIRSS